MIPYERLISALIREHNAAVRVNGSFSASWAWNMVIIALRRKSVTKNIEHEG